jgi:hypothetical protein
MKIKSQELSYCFDKTNEIAEHYLLAHIGADDPQRSVNNLISTCQKYLNVEIKLKKSEISYTKNSVWGTCIDRRNGQFDICFADGLNECWERFVICKEAFHVVLTKDEYRNMSICGHIEELVVEVPDGHEPGLSNMAEKLSELAAMEFLLPYLSRVEIIRNGKISYEQIAERYKVPLVFVEMYMSEQLIKFLAPYCLARIVPPKTAQIVR